MKKLLAIILSFYTLALVASPCVDFVSEKAACQKEVSIAQNEHQHDNDTEDHCSPFCACACCSTQVVQAEFTYTDQIYTISYQTSFENPSGHLPSVYSTIFQPPI